MMQDAAIVGSLRRPSPSDEDLWAAALAGEQSAFEQLYRRYEATAIRVAERICGRDAAEDAVQATFLSLWRNRGGYQPARGSLRHWMLGAVRNRAIDTLRCQHRRRPEQSALESEHELVDLRLTEIEVVTRETSRDVRAAVAELPLTQRQVIELAYFGEYSQSEIASALRLPLGTVKGRTRLAFAKLVPRLNGERTMAGAS